MAEDDCIVLQQLTEKLSSSNLQSQLLMNDLTPEDLCNITSTLNNVLMKIFENEKFTSICELEESMEAAAKKYNFVFERIVETEQELKAPKPAKPQKIPRTKVEHIDFSRSAAIIDSQKAEQYAMLKKQLLTQSKEAEDLNLMLSRELITSKEDLKVLQERTNILDNKLQTTTHYNTKKSGFSKTSNLHQLTSALTNLSEEKETLAKEQSELEYFMDEIEVEIRMKQQELNRMKNSLENEQKLLSATKNNACEMITAQAMGALHRNALLTPLPLTLSSVRKDGEEVCLKAKLRSENEWPMSSFSMRFSSVEDKSAEHNSSIGPCIKHITFTTTAKKPEIHASAEYNNETSHNILAGLSIDKESKVNISEFTEKEEVSSFLETPRRVKDKPLAKEKNCLCTIF